MSINYTRAWSETVYNGGTKQTTHPSGTVTDVMRDDRPLPLHSKKGKWRPPLPYYRKIESGMVKTFNLSGRTKFTNQGFPFTIETSGARDSGGTYYRALPSPPLNMENLAIIKARLKLKNQDINLGNAFGERAQTARLVAANLTKLRNLVSHVKRRNFFLPKNRRPSKEDFFDYWLELQYGWKPLISDCYGAAKALEEREQARNGGGIVTVKANVGASSRIVRRLHQGVSIISVGYDQIVDVRHKGFIRLDFVQSNPALATLSQLGLTNPLEVAWELLPWSFVADWFIPIGDYLDSLDATVGWDFKGGSYSVKSTQKVNGQNASQDPNSNYKNPSGFFVIEGKGRQMQFTRTVYGTAPLPTLPSFHKLGKSSVDHVNNGIALLMSAIVGKARVR